MFSSKVPEFPWLGVRTAARFALCVLVDALLLPMLLSDGDGCPLSSPPLFCAPWWLRRRSWGPGRPAALLPPPDEKGLPHLGKTLPIEKKTKKGRSPLQGTFLFPYTVKAENRQRKLRRTPA